MPDSFSRLADVPTNTPAYSNPDFQWWKKIFRYYENPNFLKLLPNILDSLLSLVNVPTNTLAYYINGDKQKVSYISKTKLFSYPDKIY